MGRVLPAIRNALKGIAKAPKLDAIAAERLAAIEELAKKYGTKGLPEKIATTGKPFAELQAEQRLLEKADITPYDKRVQFLQQAMNRKLPAAAGVAGGAGLMATGGNEAQASEIPVEMPPAAEEPGMISKAFGAIDKYTGRPTRAAVGAALSGENPLTAAKESITKDHDVPGQEVAHKLLEKMDIAAGGGLRSPGQEEFPAEKPLGIAADMALDPTLALPVGKFGKLKAAMGM